MVPNNPFPIGTFITTKINVQRGWGSALTHGNIYRIIEYKDKQYVVEFIRSILPEFMAIDRRFQPRDDRFSFPTYTVDFNKAQLLFDQNDIEFHKR